VIDLCEDRATAFRQFWSHLWAVSWATLVCCETLAESLNTRVHHANKGDAFMKKVALLTAAVLALLSIAGCAQDIGMGKGKAPPPVVTKG
jgi:hypothetical protein